MRLVLALLLVLIQSISAASTLTGRVVSVTDGDTLIVLGPGNAQHKVRLQGIDAPERGQAYGTKSKEHLSGSVAGKFVVVEYEKRDRYERIVGKVLLSGEDMNLEQIRAVLGRVTKVSGQPMQIFGGVYYNPENNDVPAPEWTVKFQLGWLFPQ